MRIVIAGGGTAGHVNPALALAAELSGHEVSFAGTATGAEARLVPEAGYELDLIEVAGLDRARPWAAPAVALRALAAVGAARRLLRRRRPDVVVGVGGYVSLPVGLAARLGRIPLVIHEQNAVLGLANRVLKPLAAAVAVSFEDTRAQAGPGALVTGNPVLPQIARFERAALRQRGLEVFGLDGSRPAVLVFGGSQGAERINRAAAGLAAAWRERDDVQVVHITGRAAYGEVGAAVARALAGARLTYRVVPFVEDMALAYAAADVAVCRGGATTIAELCVVGLPAVIVPYPHHRDRQQERHALILERAGAALHLPDAEATPQRLGALLDELLAQPDRRAAMACAAAGLGRPDAARRLAEVVLEAAA